MKNYEPQKDVETFAKKHSLALGIKLNTCMSFEHDEILKSMSDVLIEMSKALLEQFEVTGRTDIRLLRVHLQTEELGEELQALALRDVVGTADAAGDLLYVTYGLGVSLSIPLPEVFQEIHKSNMTKAVRDPSDTRLRNKGPEYVAPNIAAVLKLYGENNV